MSCIRQRTEEIPLWPKFESTFKGTPGNLQASKSINSISKMATVGNMKLWPMENTNKQN